MEVRGIVRLLEVKAAEFTKRWDVRWESKRGVKMPLALVSSCLKEGVSLACGRELQEGGLPFECVA